MYLILNVIYIYVSLWQHDTYLSIFLYSHAMRMLRKKKLYNKNLMKLHMHWHTGFWSNIIKVFVTERCIWVLWTNVRTYATTRCVSIWYGKVCKAKKNQYLEITLCGHMEWLCRLCLLIVTKLCVFYDGFVLGKY